MTLERVTESCAASSQIGSRGSRSRLLEADVTSLCPCRIIPFRSGYTSRCLISGSLALILETLSLDASGAFRTTPFHAFVSGLHTVDAVVICRVPLRAEGTALPF